MCAIAGQVSFGSRPLASEIEALSNRQAHRGPDDSGLWSSPRGECVLAHRRLSVIDLSERGHQPMLEVQTGNSIVFNGEIYNYRELRLECELAGYKFSSDTDTEVILALYSRLGVKCLSRLRGMFSIAIWDNAAEHLFLARDRAGKKPLHYSLSSGSIIFGSELGALARFSGIDRSIDPIALTQYFQLHYIPHPRTIYKSIAKLPPGHFAVFDRDGLRIESYWTLDFEPQEGISEQQAIDRFEDIALEAVRLRLVSDVPVGALLSGGLDSSLVLAMMSKASSTPINSFCIRFDERQDGDPGFAEITAKHLGAVHREVVLTPDLIEILTIAAIHHGEPFADASTIPAFIVSAAAREFVTVAVNGDGGDEILAGYGRYRLSPAHIAFAKSFPNAVRPKALAAMAGRFMGAGVIDRAARRAISAGPWPELNSITMYGGYFGDSELRQLLDGSYMGNELGAWRDRWLTEAFNHADNPVDRMLWFDFHTYLADGLLPKSDISSMHVGLEVRSPLLDHNLIEFCATLPMSMKIRGKTEKYLLRRVAENYLPPDIVSRKKQGFDAPVARWLLGPLLPVVKHLIQSGEYLTPLNIDRVRKDVESFYSGRNYYLAPRIWALLMYGLWREQDLKC